jgi:hypothetical protein
MKITICNNSEIKNPYFRQRTQQVKQGLALQYNYNL